MSDIYDEMNTRTGPISTYAIIRDGQYVARLIFINKAACTCYLQVFGAPPAKGIARGGNYDRHSAAAEAAIAKVEKIEDRPNAEGIRRRMLELLCDPKLEGQHWDGRLIRNGFDVLSVLA